MNGWIKRNWKSKILTLAAAGALVTAFAFTANARWGSGHMGDPGYRVEGMVKVLDLTPEQQTKINEILKSEDAKFDALHRSDFATRRDMMDQVIKLREDTRTEINKVLSPDQLSKLKAVEEYRKGADGVNGYGPGYYCFGDDRDGGRGMMGNGRGYGRGEGWCY